MHLSNSGMRDTFAAQTHWQDYFGGACQHEVWEIDTKDGGRSARCAIPTLQEAQEAHQALAKLEPQKQTQHTVRTTRASKTSRLVTSNRQLCSQKTAEMSKWSELKRTPINSGWGSIMHLQHLFLLPHNTTRGLCLLMSRLHIVSGRK